uniref:fumarylacetoacetase n=1 Tax=unclassified Frankia TaxID=2632575 RepID=UPI002AD41529
MTRSSLRAWVDVADDSPWGPQTLPYAVADLATGPRVVVRIGDHAVDTAAVAHRLAPDLVPLLETPTLDVLLAAGPARWAAVRASLVDWLTDPAHRAEVEPHLSPVEHLRTRLPFTVADYVDFYSSRHHAENLGALFRPGQPALSPNWLHQPIGYHGRSGTVVVSGTDVVRPHGQTKPSDAVTPLFGPSRRLDIEAEVGFVVGVPSSPGRPVPADAFEDHVFGVVLVNDWSARDLQSWEYVPLGPFLGKSFATSVSAWITPLAALRDARVRVPEREVPTLPYLAAGEDEGLDIELTVELGGEVVSRPPFAPMYWSPAQQLAHLTANGAHLRTGDLFASGTVSGPEPDQRGSLIELSWNGAEPLQLSDGSARAFLEDGDEVVP